MGSEGYILVPIKRIGEPKHPIRENPGDLESLARSIEREGIISLSREDTFQTGGLVGDEGKHALNQVTVTKMFTGIEYKYERNTEAYREARENLERLLSRFKIIQIDRSISIEAAKIMADLKKRGRPVDDLHDVYIAATGVKRDLEILTKNPGHFRNIEGLEVRDWEEY